MVPLTAYQAENEAKPKMSRLAVLKHFFQQPTQTYPTRNLGLEELKCLSTAERHELGDLCAKQMNVEISE